MSFAKSKSKRFSDKTSDVPPPGAYDPKFMDKGPGALIDISKDERFKQPKRVSELSSMSTLGALDLSTLSCNASTPRKSLMFGSSLKTKEEKSNTTRNRIISSADATKLKELEREVRKLVQERNDLERKFQERGDEVIRLDARLQQAVKDKSALTSKAAILEKDLMHIKKSNEVLKHKTTTIDNNIEKHKQVQQHSLEKVKDQLCKKDQEIDYLKEQIKSLKSENRELDKFLTLVKTEKEAMQNKLDELHENQLHLDQEQAEQKEQMSKLVEQNKSLEVKLEKVTKSKESEVENVKKSLNEHHKKVQEHMARTIERLRTNLLSSNECHVTLSEYKEALCAEMDSLRDTLKTLAIEKFDNEELIRHLKGELFAVTDEMLQDKEFLQQAQNDVSVLCDQLKQLKESESLLNDNIRLISSKYELLENDLASMEKDNQMTEENLRKELTASRKTYSDLLEEHEFLHTTNHNLVDELAKEQQYHKDIDRLNADLSIEKNIQTQTMDDYEQQLAEFRDDVRLKNKRIDDLHSQLGEKNYFINEIEDKLLDEGQTVTRLEADIAEYRLVTEELEVKLECEADCASDFKTKLHTQDVRYSDLEARLAEQLEILNVAKTNYQESEARASHLSEALAEEKYKMVLLEGELGEEKKNLEKCQADLAAKTQQYEEYYGRYNEESQRCKHLVEILDVERDRVQTLKASATEDASLIDCLKVQVKLTTEEHDHEMEEQTEQHDRLVVEVNKLKQDVEDLNSKLEARQIVIDGVTTQMSEHKFEHNQLLKEAELRLKKIDLLETELTEKNDMVEEYSAKLGAKQTLLGEFTEQIKCKDCVLDTMSKERAEIQQDLENTNTALSELKTKTEGLITLLESQRIELESVHDDLDKKINETEELAQSLASSEEQVESLHQQISVEKDKSKQLEEKLSGEETKTEYLEETLEVETQKSQQLEEKAMELDAKLKCVEGRLGGETESLEQLQSMYNAEEVENVELNEQLCEFKEKSEELGLALERARERVTSLEGQLKQNDTLINNLNSVAHDANDRIDNLEKALQEEIAKAEEIGKSFTKSKNSVKEGEAKRNELNDTLKLRDDEIANMAGKLQEVSKRAAELQETQSLLKQLKAKCMRLENETQTEMRTMKQKLVEAECVAHEARMQTAQTQAEAEKLIQRMVRSQHEEYEQRKRQEHEHLRSAEEKEQESGEEISRLQHELSQLRWELEEAQRQESAGALEELEELRAKYRRMCEMIEPFQEQLNAFEAEKLSLLGRNRNAQNEVDKLSRDYAKLLGHQNQKQKIKHVLKLKEENAAYKRDNDVLRDQAGKLKRQVTMLERKISEGDCRRSFDPTKAFMHCKENIKSHPRSPLREGNRF